MDQKKVFRTEQHCGIDRIIIDKVVACAYSSFFPDGIWSDFFGIGIHRHIFACAPHNAFFLACGGLLQQHTEAASKGHADSGVSYLH